MEVKKERDYSISFVRFVAMVSIIVCHIMQRDGVASDICGAKVEWCAWFNTGVFMFLFVSGYLYGKKKIETLPFYYKTALKVLVDYEIFVISMIVLYIILRPVILDLNSILALITVTGVAPGIEHLWFVSCILFCYILTPIFKGLTNALNSVTGWKYWGGVVVLLAVTHFITQNTLFLPPWINTYLLGMLYAETEIKDKAYRRTFLVATMILCMILLPVRIYFDYYSHIELPFFLQNRYVLLRKYAAAFLGILMVIILRKLYNCKNFGRACYLDWSDKYSYDVYLTHHVFVQSAFACVEWISNRIIAIPLALVLTIIASMLLHTLSDLARNRIEVFNRCIK